MPVWDVGDMSQVEIPLAVNGVHDTTSVRCCSYDGNFCESDVGGVCHLDKTFVGAHAICAKSNMRLGAGQVAPLVERQRLAA